MSRTILKGSKKGGSEIGAILPHPEGRSLSRNFYEAYVYNRNREGELKRNKNRARQPISLIFPISTKKGQQMTEQELENLPEVHNKVLWQNDEDPSFVTDSKGVSWFIGFYKGNLSKCRMNHLQFQKWNTMENEMENALEIENALSDEIGDELLKLWGLQDGNVRKMTIILEAGKFPVLKIEKYMDKEKTKEMKNIIKRYKIIGE